MRKVCRRLCLLASLILAVLAFLWLLLPVDQDHYFAATIDKHQRLAQTPSPKVVLVGGSNLACGVDTERLEQAIGCPVVNMGLHADIGLAYMLAEVRGHLAAGDRVILIPEYEQFFGLRNGNMGVLKAMSYQQGGWKYLRTPDQWAVALLQSVNYLQGKLKYYLEQTFHVEQDPHYHIYHRGGFNPFGDLVSHLDQPPVPLQENDVQPFNAARLDRRSIRLINRFNQEMQAKGVQVCLLYPGYYDRLLSRHTPALNRLREALGELQCPVLGTPERYAFPLECFYDTEYHLNRRGRSLRTEKMIVDLNKFLR
ncbi:MAG TPA: hypothetical protein PK843_05370 [bacterium]|nr:hypothetical protein [bacterium]HPN33920.1 hypothetical protein [bacterium]